MSEKISFVEPDTGEKVEFYVIEETRISNVNYLLVAMSDDDSDDESEAYILKDVSSPEAEDAIYEIVEDENELNAVSKVFSELVEDEYDIE